MPKDEAVMLTGAIVLDGLQADGDTAELRAFLNRTQNHGHLSRLYGSESSSGVTNNHQGPRLTLNHACGQSATGIDTLKCQSHPCEWTIHFHETDVPSDFTSSPFHELLNVLLPPQLLPSASARPNTIAELLLTNSTRPIVQQEHDPIELFNSTRRRASTSQRRIPPHPPLLRPQALPHVTVATGRRFPPINSTSKSMTAKFNTTSRASKTSQARPNPQISQLWFGS